MIAFAVLGVGATLFLPVPAWARWTMVAGIAGSVAALAVAGAEKILKREVDAKAHADMLNQLKAQI